MSLKFRLRISILALVFTVVFALSILHIHDIVEESFHDAHERSELIAGIVESYVVEQGAGGPDWDRNVREDQTLTRLLQQAVSRSSMVTEIVVADRENRVLSAARARDRPALPVQPFSEWQEESLWTRLRDVYRDDRLFELALPLTISGETRGAIKVLLSSALLRARVEPQLRGLALLSLAALAVASGLAMLVSNLVTKSLVRIAQSLEDIAAGKGSNEDSQGFESRELSDLDAKVRTLGRQYRGAREGIVSLRSNIDQMLQRLEEAVLVFDPDAHLQTAAAPAERLLLKSKNELVGRSLDDLFPDWTPIGAALQASIRLQKPLHDRAVTYERPNLPPARLLLSTEFFHQQDAARKSMLVTLKDADTRRQLESQLDISTRLAAISRVTSGVAHEIKNPLNAIALHLEVAKGRVAGKDPGLEHELEIIGNEIRRLDRVVNTFVDFNKPIEMQITDCDLTELGREVADLLSTTAQSHSIKLDFQPEIESAPVSGDRDLLKQAIQNVVVNGIEAMQETGNLMIRTYQTFDEYVLTITDEGQGIAPEIQDKIFNLYFTTKDKAAGIGLSVTFRVVQIHNGKIDFDSEVGKGTSFHLRFPRSTKTQAATT